jgi:hypothetical protein
MRTGDGRVCIGFDIGLINRKRAVSRKTMAAFAQDGHRAARRSLRREFSDCHIFVMRRRDGLIHRQSWDAAVCGQIGHG